MVVELTEPAALVVVDLQAGTLVNPFVHPAEEIVRAANSLIGAIRERGGIVAFATSTGTPPGRNAYGSPQRVFPHDARVLAAGLDAREGDVLVARSGLSVFADTDLTDLLRERGIATIVFAGVATTFGVESSVRAAYDLGFHVIVASDAITDLRVETHEHALQFVFPAIAQVSTSSELVDVLSQEA